MIKVIGDCVQKEPVLSDRDFPSLTFGRISVVRSPEHNPGIKGE